MSLRPSPLAPKFMPDMPFIPGFRLTTACSGTRYKGRDDFLLLEAAEGSQVAGVFTRNAICGAPVTWSRQVARDGLLRGLLVNAGNANVALGKAGMQALQAKTQQAAALLDCEPGRIAVASTGVIGAPLDPAPFVTALTHMVPALEHNTQDWTTAAKAIMTTDTFPKWACASCDIDGQSVQIAAIAKGSGMIEPNMGTMLAFVATDANLPASVLDAVLRDVTARSLNAVTVDGDTSTSDMCLLMASCQAKHARIHDAEDQRLDAFVAALEQVLTSLAIMIARDGEGASKLITINVTGAVSDAEAMLAAKAVANSPLVKTAIAGQDANWGRIAMAIGKSGAKLNPDRYGIAMGGTPIVESGGLRANYDEAPVVRHLAGQDIDIAIDLAMGHGKATAWTCDLTHAYIDINADYRS